MAQMYYHINPSYCKSERYTVSIANNYLTYMNNGCPLEILIKIGIAKVHPDDAYVKAVGRKQADSKSLYELFKLVSFDAECSWNQGKPTAVYRTTLNDMVVNLWINIDTRKIFKVDVYSSFPNMESI